MKHYSPTGRRNRGRPLKGLLDTWDRNGSTSGLTPWQTCEDDDDDDLPLFSVSISSLQLFMVLLRSYWNLVMIFSFISCAPLFEIKCENFCSYSFWYIITIELPLSAFVTRALFLSTLSLIKFKTFSSSECVLKLYLLCEICWVWNFSIVLPLGPLGTLFSLALVGVGGWQCHEK